MKPQRVFIVRHGESQGNVDKKIYQSIPDYALQLTDVGRVQAEEAGKRIASIIGKAATVQYYVSPFFRTRQTYLGIKKHINADCSEALRNEVEKYYEDPRLREQEWGQRMESREGYKEKVEEYRDNYGHFYYRFLDGGESCADVYDRVSDFMGTLFRDFGKYGYADNVIIVTHGMTMRLFLMRWFHVPVEEFETWGNPQNCEFFLLERDGKNDKYKLVTPIRKVHKVKHPFQFDWGNDMPNFGHALPYATVSSK